MTRDAPVRQGFDARALLRAGALGLGLSLGGCVSLLPRSDPVALYQFVDPADPSGAPASREGLRPIILPPIDFTRPATSDGMLTVTGERAAYIAGARWVAPARVLFQEALQHEFMFKTTKVRLAGTGEASRPALSLDVRVARFEADYDAPDRAPRVEVVLEARLTAGASALGVRAVHESRPAADNSVKAIVAAYTAAVAAATADLGAWTDQLAGAAGP